MGPREEVMIKAVIFDFDGLILDTEGPDYQAWRELYQAYGCSLPLSKWVQCLGSTDTFCPYAYLEQQLGRRVDRATIRSRRRARFEELMSRQGLLPGVEQCILEARRLGLKVGLASSASRSWVGGYLSALGIADWFDSVKCANDVVRTKPDPAVYIAALRALQVEACEAMAFEDSPNGILAAKRAGVFCVVVPNALTENLVLDGADLRIPSLDGLSLEELLRRRLLSP